MRAREWLREVKDPKVAAMQRDMRTAGALNVSGPKAGKPLTVDGIEGPNTRYNMNLPQFAGIVSQYKKPSVAQPQSTVADADSLAPSEELAPATAPVTVGPDETMPPVARPAMLHTATPADAYKPAVATNKVPPKYDGIDPIVRSRMGMPPATTAEIDAYIKAHPPVVGNLVSSDGTPVQSGGAKEVERAARQAAKEYETKTGQNPNISQDTRDAALASVAQDGSITIGNEKRIGGTLSWRANNPGNSMTSGLSKQYGSIGTIVAGDGVPTAIFPTLDKGVQLQMDQWRRPMYANLTIDAGCQQWATGVKEQGYGSPYARDLAKAAGATLDTKVKDLSDDQLKRMCLKQAKWEGWKPGKVVAVNNTKTSTATA